MWCQGIARESGIPVCGGRLRVILGCGGQLDELIAVPLVSCARSALSGSCNPILSRTVFRGQFFADIIFREYCLSPIGEMETGP